MGWRGRNRLQKCPVRCPANSGAVGEQPLLSASPYPCPKSTCKSLSHRAHHVSLGNGMVVSIVNFTKFI